MSLRDSIFETDYIKPIIKSEDILKLNEYNQNKTQYTCSICKNIFLNPIMCSNCKNIFCKDCIFPYVMENNKCFKGCDYFELTIPNQQNLTLFQNFTIKCRSCNTAFPIMDFYEHNKKCQSNKKKVKCWNCNSIVNAEKLKYPSQSRYSLKYDFNKHLSFDGDKPFLMEISTKDITGWVTLKGDKLFAIKNQNFAVVFSEVVVEGERYFKLLVDNDWKFLSNGFFGICTSSWERCTSVIFDKEKMTISYNGLFGKTPLTMRITDKKLFFTKPSNMYHECKIKFNYLDTV